MNINKTIKELQNRLDEVHPYSASLSFNNDQNRNDDGINYWKGKKIISTKDWNDLYQKSSTFTNDYTTILMSRKPLLYFLDDYHSPISSIGIISNELREEIEKWNTDYYELLEYRKNPTLGRMKCSKCLLSGSLDDPIFVGIEKVFARIVSDQCNNDNVNTNSPEIITYHCNVMNIFSCPFESKDELKYPYKREDLFALQQISFAIEQAITRCFEITKQNEIIYEVDFVNDKVQEIHTKYSGEPESWGWQENVKEQLSRVKPISTIKIRDEQDIYNILTNRKKLETLIEEYEKKNNHRLEEQEICCDENTPCVNSSDNEKLPTSNSLLVGSGQYQVKYQDNVDNDSHKGENRHSKNNTEKDEELDIEYLKPELKSKIKEELKKHKEEQLILLKQNKEGIIDFLSGNKDSIRIEDLKIYEPIYKCHRQKGHCHICNSLTNIICISCSHNYKNKGVWLCAYHWKQHGIDNH